MKPVASNTNRKALSAFTATALMEVLRPLTITQLWQPTLLLSRTMNGQLGPLVQQLFLALPTTLPTRPSTTPFLSSSTLVAAEITFSQATSISALRPPSRTVTPASTLIQVQLNSSHIARILWARLKQFPSCQVQLRASQKQLSPLSLVFSPSASTENKGFSANLRTSQQRVIPR